MLDFLPQTNYSFVSDQIGRYESSSSIFVYCGKEIGYLDVLTFGPGETSPFEVKGIRTPLLAV